MGRIDFGAPNGDWCGQTLLAIRKAFASLDSEPLREARIVTSVSLSPTADTRVRHGLGHPIRGYILARSPVDVRVFDGAAPETIDAANFVSLRASATATVSLLVF